MPDAREMLWEQHAEPQQKTSNQHGCGQDMRLTSRGAVCAGHVTGAPEEGNLAYLSSQYDDQVTGIIRRALRAGGIQTVATPELPADARAEMIDTARLFITAHNEWEPSIAAAVDLGIAQGIAARDPRDSYRRRLSPWTVAGIVADWSMEKHHPALSERGSHAPNLAISWKPPVHFGAHQSMGTHRDLHLIGIDEDGRISYHLTAEITPHNHWFLPGLVTHVIGAKPTRYAMDGNVHNEQFFDRVRTTMTSSRSLQPIAKRDLEEHARFRAEDLNTEPGQEPSHAYARNLTAGHDDIDTALTLAISAAFDLPLTHSRPNGNVGKNDYRGVRIDQTETRQNRDAEIPRAAGIVCGVKHAHVVTLSADGAVAQSYAKPTHLLARKDLPADCQIVYTVLEKNPQMQRLPDSRYCLEINPSVDGEGWLSDRMHDALSAGDVSVTKAIVENLRERGGYLHDNETAYALALAINAWDRAT